VESLTPTAIPYQLINRPDMIGQISRHRRRSCQGRMHVTEIVHAPGPKQCRFQLDARTRWRARAPHQSWHPGAQRRIQPLDIRGVDAAHLNLCCLHQSLGSHQAAMRQPSRDALQPSASPLLHDLHDVQVLPDHQRRTTTLARMHRVAKHLQNALHIGFEAINREQNRLPGSGGRARVFDHRRDQLLVALPANRAPQPQARKDRHRGGNPDRACLCFGVQLIRLYLAQIELSPTDELLLDRFGMLPSLALPVSHSALVQTKREDDCRNRATTGEQGQHDQYQPECMLEAEKRSTAGFGEGLATGVTFVTAFFERMDANRSVCVAGRVGAYCQFWTHRWKGGCKHTPNLLMRSVLSSRLHAILRRYPAVMTEHNTQRLNELLELKERRLHELEKRQSVGGIDTPPQVTIEIEDIRNEISIMRGALSTGITPAEALGSKPVAKSQSRKIRISWIIVGFLLLTNILLIYRTPIAILPPNDLSINSMPLQVWPGIGPNFDKDSYNKLVVIKNGDNPTDISYKYYCSIPGKSEYYSSMVFEINNPEDLSPYNKVQLDMTINRAKGFSFDLNFNNQRNDRNAYYTRKLSSTDGETINFVGDGVRKRFTFDMNEVKTKIDSKNIVWIWIVIGNDSENLLVSDFTVNQITFIRS
jgi:hypothetical protein